MSLIFSVCVGPSQGMMALAGPIPTMSVVEPGTGHQKVWTKVEIEVLNTSHTCSVAQVKVHDCFKCENRFGRSVSEFPLQLVL